MHRESIADLTTAVKYGMDIVLVLLDNGQLGKISKEQRAAHLEVWQTSLHKPDFAEYAQICGAWGRRAERPEEIEEALAAALEQSGPALIQVVADPDLL